MPQYDQHDAATRWSRKLGLAMTELFPSTTSGEHTHYALLNGVEGNFMLSTGPDDRTQALDWAWSSQLDAHVEIGDNTVRARHVTPNTPLLEFAREQVEAHTEQFLEALIDRRVEPPATIVDHVVRCFRSHRIICGDHGLSTDESLDAFLSLIGDLIGKTETPLDERLPPDHRARFEEEMLYNPLVQRNTDLNLTMRHAAGMVFQEAHAELSSEPIVSTLLGPPSAPHRSTRNRLGAYYTPPNLARLLTDIAIASYLDQDIIRIADPACGSGAFLTEAAHSLRRNGYSGRIELIGLDLSHSATEMARFALRHNGTSAHADVNIKAANFLEVQEPLDADVIVTNPPFVATPYLDPQLRNRVREILGPAYVYRPDLSMAFCTLALSHLKPGGMLATLLPAGVLSQSGGKRWRASIAEANSVELIAVLGDHGLFRDAVVNIAALAVRKTAPRREFPPVTLWSDAKKGASSEAQRRLRRWMTGDQRPERTPHWSIDRHERQAITSGDDWTPRPNMLGDLPMRIRGTRYVAPVKDLFDIELGIRAGRMKKHLQLATSEFEDLPRGERKLFRPVAETRSIHGGRIHPVSWAFYPKAPMTYAQVQETAPVYSERHLDHLKLSADAIVDFARPRRRTNTSGLPRLVSRAFISTDSFAADPRGQHVVVQGYSWFPRPEVLSPAAKLVELLDDYLMILNSRMFFLLAREHGRLVAGGQVDGAKNQIGDVPLPDLPALYHDIRFSRLRLHVEAIRTGSREPGQQGLDEVIAAMFGTSLSDWQFSA